MTLAALGLHHDCVYGDWWACCILIGILAGAVWIYIAVKRKLPPKD